MRSNLFLWLLSLGLSACASSSPTLPVKQANTLPHHTDGCLSTRLMDCVVVHSPVGY